MNGGSDASGATGTATGTGTRTAVAGSDTATGGERLAETQSPRTAVDEALREIRREGLKIAVVYSVVDAALATLLVNLAFHLFGTEWPLGPFLVDGTLPGTTLVAVGVGLLVGGVEFAVRRRRPIVEQFEAANPSVSELLRTARDAVAADRDSRMARVLYVEVLARLRETSSVDLVDLRRLSLTLVVVLVLSVASIQVAVVDLDLGGGDSSADSEADPSYDGLRDGSEVLGAAENVSAGDNEIDARISGAGEGDAPPGGASSSYDAGGVPSGDVESQQAGFSAAERLEDSELIRDYNLELRNETNA
ncbi:hypothetical protein SAMN04487948_104118 [Halogranum amylolyticum]|uniref:Uncharacterized protein n=1 Tax=Halogranum amylolyticum TaxID=660520 RepID=A0A1H8RN10_9EURY|nr:hypothetical protein [Halogranum amylolyticum]SEO67578.1 hypothetical protein SAMN04487948_104118 [Halogranum amylolyticum]